MPPRSLGAVPLGALVATKVPCVEARHVSAPQVGTAKGFEATLAGSDQTAGTAAAMIVMNVAVFMLVVVISVEWWIVAMNRLTTCASGRLGDGLCTSLADSVYFEPRPRFPADGQTVAIGTSDGVSECRCECAVGQRKTSRSCSSGSELLYGSLVRGYVGCTLGRWTTSDVSESVRLKTNLDDSSGVVEGP
jgi:hypothetical protein